ncbi:leucyl/phenylalanyl-tRNA--protein transferase [Qipengyuania sp. DSG2-2]|uniref:leucyl/phenylalanyl-tRNA--protein transferase n=1 Tax=Qipengyuania sp. DGS2-2 TaxID=3349631 RepID=UPI0036D289B6
MHAPMPSLISPELLLSAYRHGIFPMADSRTDTEIFWVEPRERAILPIDGFRLSRSLARTLRRGKFLVTCNTAFREVVRGCAGPREDADGTWISGRIEASYAALHARGDAHSIECWEGETLVGGVYGVGFDSVFCGESMFSRRTDASKVALAWLVALLGRAGCKVFDCQFMTSHLESLGAVPLTQKAYMQMVADAAVPQRMTLEQAYASLSSEAEDDPSSSPGKLIAHSLTQTS